MSIWYHLDVEVLSQDKTAVAKFFNLDNSSEYVRTDRFSFSFGGKNAPSLHLRKIIEKNPDLIFLVRMSIECDTEEWFLTRFDVATKQQQFVKIQDCGSFSVEYNKRLLEEYAKEYPSLLVKHFAQEKGYETFRWSMFLNSFEKSALVLNQQEQYKEMTCPNIEADLDFDNSPLAEDD